MKLPKHIVDSIRSNRTSLGVHPSFPPDDEETFMVKIVDAYFSELTEGIGTDNADELRNELSRMISECMKIERNSKESLEGLVTNVVNGIFRIPEDTVTVEANIVSSVNGQYQRLLPERTDDFEFESIDDMNALSDEIYKRRMIDALVAGASLSYSSDINRYLSELFGISPELPSLYSKILRYNNILMYLEKDALSPKDTTEAGKVDVIIHQSQNKVQIKSEGIIFPILLNETIKGFNELAVSHGLPKERTKAEYVIKKADFKLAEMWDARLGLPLWNRIARVFDKIEVDIDDVGLNFFLMALSCLSVSDFNTFLREAFAGTKKSEVFLRDMVDKITDAKDQDEFDDYMNTQRSNAQQLSDSEYFSPDELISDSL